jgi:hypothetical protein
VAGQFAHNCRNQQRPEAVKDQLDGMMDALGFV